MVQFFDLSEGRLRRNEDPTSPVEVYINPDDRERSHLIVEVGIDEHNLMSALDPNEVSRLEVEDNYVAIIYKKPKNYHERDQFTFKAFTVGVFYLKNRLIIIVSEEVTLFEEKFFTHLQTLTDVILKLLSEAINHFMMHLRVISMMTDELENRITTAMENQYLLNLFAISKSLVYYLNAIEANNTLIHKMKRNVQRLEFQERQVDVIEDVLIENTQCYRQAEIYSTILAGMMDARGTIVNNNMNVLIKQLTIINIIFLPINFIASVGGMSEYSMMTEYLDWRVSYALFMLAMVVIGYITYLMIKKLEFVGEPGVKRRVRSRSKSLLSWPPFELFTKRNL